LQKQNHACQKKHILGRSTQGFDLNGLNAAEHRTDPLAGERAYRTAIALVRKMPEHSGARISCAALSPSHSAIAFMTLSCSSRERWMRPPSRNCVRRKALSRARIEIACSARKPLCGVAVPRSVRLRQVGAALRALASAKRRSGRRAAARRAPSPELELPRRSHRSTRCECDRTGACARPSSLPPVPSVLS
jgi:hypothetical protein